MYNICVIVGFPKGEGVAPRLPRGPVELVPDWSLSHRLYEMNTHKTILPCPDLESWGQGGGPRTLVWEFTVI